MAYGVVYNVPAPVEMYDAVHAKVLEQGGGSVQGLLCHLARATADGFQVVEIWENKELCDRYNADIVDPAIARAQGDRVGPPRAQVAEEFDVRGLVIPAAGVTI
jgi:hypothetical protein